MAESDISFTALADFQPLTWYNLDSQKVFKRIYYISDDGNTAVGIPKNDQYNRLYTFKKSINNGTIVWNTDKYIALPIPTTGSIEVYNNTIIYKDYANVNITIYKFDIVSGQASLLSQYTTPRESIGYNLYNIEIFKILVSDNGSTICYAAKKPTNMGVSVAYVYCSKDYGKTFTKITEDEYIVNFNFSPKILLSADGSIVCFNNKYISSQNGSTVIKNKNLTIYQ
jgi:hypothetical protein